MLYRIVTIINCYIAKQPQNNSGGRRVQPQNNSGGGGPTAKQLRGRGSNHKTTPGEEGPTTKQLRGRGSNHKTTPGEEGPTTKQLPIITPLKGKITIELKARAALEEILELYSQKPELGSAGAIEESRQQLDEITHTLDKLQEDLYKYQVIDKRLVQITCPVQNNIFKEQFSASFILMKIICSRFYMIPVIRDV